MVNAIRYYRKSMFADVVPGMTGKQFANIKRVGTFNNAEFQFVERKHGSLLAFSPYGDEIKAKTLSELTRKVMKKQRYYDK
jgi:hypothetical protein